MSELEITQDRMEKLLKLEQKIKELKGINQDKDDFSILEFLSFLLRNIVESPPIIFILFCFLIAFLSTESLIILAPLLMSISVIALIVTVIVIYRSLQRCIYQRLDRVDVGLLKSAFDKQDTFIHEVIEYHSTKNGFVIEQFNSNMQAIKSRFNRPNY